MDERELSLSCAPEEREEPKRPSDMTFEELTALLDEVYKRTLSPPAPTDGEENAPTPDGDAEVEQPDDEKDPETQQVEDAEEELREFLESLNEEEKNAFFTKMAERFGEQFEEIVALIEELDPSFRVDQEEIEEETDEAETSDVTPPEAFQNGVDEATGERIIPPPYSVIPPPYGECSAQADADDPSDTEQAFEGEASEQENETELAVDASQMPLEANGEGGAEGVTSTTDAANTPTDATSDTETSLLDEEARYAAESLSQALQTVLESCEKLRAVYRACGFCQSCGGSFKGIFRRVCRQCGKPKDYKGPSFFKRLAARRSLKRQAPKQNDEIE